MTRLRRQRTASTSRTCDRRWRRLATAARLASALAITTTFALMAPAVAEERSPPARPTVSAAAASSTQPPQAAPSPVAVPVVKAQAINKEGATRCPGVLGGAPGVCHTERVAAELTTRALTDLPKCKEAAAKQESIAAGLQVQASATEMRAVAAERSYGLCTQASELLTKRVETLAAPPSRAKWLAIGLAVGIAVGIGVFYAVLNARPTQIVGASTAGLRAW